MTYLSFFQIQIQIQFIDKRSTCDVVFHNCTSLNNKVYRDQITFELYTLTHTIAWKFAHSFFSQGGCRPHGAAARCLLIDPLLSAPERKHLVRFSDSARTKPFSAGFGPYIRQYKLRGTASVVLVALVCWSTYGVGKSLGHVMTEQAVNNHEPMVLYQVGRRKPTSISDDVRHMVEFPATGKHACGEIH